VPESYPALDRMNARIAACGGMDAVPEADDVLNAASRDLVREVADRYGEAWLGRFGGTNRDSALVRWDGVPVRNFEFDFVLPAFDGDLEDDVLDYRRAPDARRLIRLIDAVAARGGHLLVWS
jgi:hypothetical protein